MVSALHPDGRVEFAQVCNGDTQSARHGTAQHSIAQQLATICGIASLGRAGLGQVTRRRLCWCWLSSPLAG
jgi:hypothetical protein